MSETGDEKKQQGRRRGNSNEKELASQQIQIQSKRFYIDVKENQRGRFIKLAEVGVGGRKSRILMTMSAANEFKNRLVEFSELHSSMGPSQGGVTQSGSTNTAAQSTNATNSDSNNRENDGLIKSETFIKDRKRYYLDLKENQRGRFLRVSYFKIREKFYLFFSLIYLGINGCTRTKRSTNPSCNTSTRSN
jgi:transcriptional activator protein Pur-alpha